MNPTPEHLPSLPLNLRSILSSLLLLGLLASCQTAPPISGPTASPVPSSPSPIEPTPQPPSPTAPSPVYSAPYLTWAEPDLPDSFQTAFSRLSDFPLTDNPTSAVVQISTENGQLFGSWVYAAVAPFYSHLEGLDFSDLKSCWSGGLSSELPFTQVLATSSTSASLTHLFGQPSGDCLLIVDEADLIEQTWLHPESVALIPFELSDPALTILQVDGQDPLSKDFDLEQYPLQLALYYQAPDEVAAHLDRIGPLTNYRKDRLTTLALTGVTALVRDTAAIMEEKGITYPALDVKDLLSGADITHINNEVPFAVDCPPPSPSQNSLQFCSDDRYLELLEFVGTDIVELSGDHFGDWGPEAMLHTLDLYQAENWLVYGGGINLQAGLEPVFITHNGNRLAFIGCNAKSFDRYATATDTNPGASRCDFDWMTAKIQELSAEGYLVIATMQHEEVDSFGSIALQQHDFRLLAEAGAVIVSGSQAHHPQAFEYDGQSFIHYGLGNLFFDQWYLATRAPEIHANKDKSFIDLHYFYNGRHISTRLIPLQFIDDARPRLMTEEEKVEFLDEVYEYSLWEGNWVYLFPENYFSEGY